MSALDRAPTLAEIGEALYGDRWQRAMARALAVSERTVRYWAVGRYPVSAAAWGDLRGIIDSRREDLSDMLARIQP